MEREGLLEFYKHTKGRVKISLSNGKEKIVEKINPVGAGFTCRELHLFMGQVDYSDILYVSFDSVVSISYTEVEGDNNE